MNKILLVIRIWFFPSLGITGSACKGNSIFKKFYLPNKRSVLTLINTSFIETFIQLSHFDTFGNKTAIENKNLKQLFDLERN